MKKALFSLAILCSQFLSAQSWTQIQDTLLEGVTPSWWAKGSYGAMIYDGVRIYNMNDYTQPWQTAMTGIPLNQRNFTGLASVNDSVYALTRFMKLYLTVDGGTSWSEITINGISSSLLNPANNIASLFAIPGRLFMTFNGDSCFSTTDGSNWNFFRRQNLIAGVYNSQIGTWTNTTHDSLILSDAQFQPHDTFYYNAAMPGSVEYTAYSNDHRYRYGYSPADSILYRIDFSNYVQSAVPYGQVPLDSTLTPGAGYYVWGKYQLITWLYLSPTGNGMQRNVFSSDSGLTWNSRPDLRWVGGFVVPELNGDTIVATNYYDQSLRFSDDGGASWTRLEPQVNGLYYDNILLTQGLDTLYWRYSPRIGSPIYKGIVRSTDGGQTWQYINSNLPYYYYTYQNDSAISVYNVYETAIVGSVVFAQVNEYYVYRTMNGGQSWQAITMPPYGSGDIPVFVGKDENSFYLSIYHWQQDTFAYYRTADFGNSWTQFYVPVGDTSGYNNPRRFQIEGMHDTLYLRYNQRIYQNPFDHFHLFFSTDNGLNWTEISPPQTISNANKRIGAFDAINPAKSGMAFSSRADKFLQIVETIDTASTYVGPAVFQDSLYLYDAGIWTVVSHSGLPSDIDMQALSYDNDTWYLSSDYGVYSSSDDGLNWAANFRMASGSQQALSVGLEDGMKMYNLHSSSGNLVSSTRGYGVWRFDGSPLESESNETNEVSGLQIFPVPADGKLIHWRSSVLQMNPMAKIVDVQGRIVLHQTVAPGLNGSIDISKLGSGVYFLELIDGTEIQRSRFVVSH